MPQRYNFITIADTAKKDFMEQNNDFCWQDKGILHHLMVIYRYLYVIITQKAASFAANDVTLQKIGRTRQIENKFSLLSFALSLQQNNLYYNELPNRKTECIHP